MSLIANAKTKAISGNVKEAFKNEEGAIDLASIMVGIIVIGLIGGVIAATVFAVIPWAQDNAAKQQLDSLAAAQSAYIGLAADQNATATTFGDATDLKAASTALFDATTAKVKVVDVGTGTSAHYIGATKSASGKIFYITDTKTQASVADGASGRATAASLTGTAIPGGTVINGITFGTGGGTPVNVNWTGSTAF